VRPKGAVVGEALPTLVPPPAPAPTAPLTNGYEVVWGAEVSINAAAERSLNVMCLRHKVPVSGGVKGRSARNTRVTESYPEHEFWIINLKNEGSMDHLVAQMTPYVICINQPRGAAATG
jgi:hypothetical protein